MTSLENTRRTKEIPFVPWETFLANHFRWSQGEHLAIIGPTGQGKTTLALNLLPLRKYVFAFATKPKDKVMDGLIKKEGYKRLDKYANLSPAIHPKRVLWPHASSLWSDTNQALEFRKAFGALYQQGGWCVFLDEVWYLYNNLGLGKEIKTYLLQARSLEISLMLLAQRPTWIPLEVFDQATHLFFFRDNDERNLMRIASIGYLSSRTIRENVARLKPHHALYINGRTGEMVQTMAPRKDP